MVRFIAVSVVSAFAFFAGVSFQDQDQESGQQEETQKRIVRPAIDDDDVERRDFMRTKLLITQNIFEGLTIGDFDLIDAGIEKVKSVTRAESWIAIDDDIYRHLTDDFTTTVERLEAAAKTKNIDAIALRYYEMSTSCIDCHKHVREAEYEL